MVAVRKDLDRPGKIGVVGRLRIIRAGDWHAHGFGDFTRNGELTIEFKRIQGKYIAIIT